jgi:ketosteroid isomerase-like protein
MPAEHPDIDVVRRAFDDFEFGRTDLDAYYSRYWHPDAVVESVDGFPMPGRYEGLDGYRRWFEETYGPYEGIQRHVHSISVEGDTVLMLLTITGRSRDDDLELEVHVGSTYEVEDGRIKRLRVYVGHERALLAARTS